MISREFSGWPILDEDTDSETGNETTTALDDLTLFARLNQMPIFGLSLGHNLKRPSQCILCIEQPTWFLSKEYYSDPSVISAYKAYMTTVLELFGAELNPNYQLDVDEAFQIELQLARVNFHDHLFSLLFSQTSRWFLG